jgi:hypothetical protein
MTPDDFRAMAMAFPGAVEGFNMGSTFFKVNGKDLARRLGGGEIMLTGIGPDEVDHLIEQDPATFHASQHFRDGRCIAARLASLDPPMLLTLLERRFRELAKKATVKEWDARRSSP